VTCSRVFWVKGQGYPPLGILPRPQGGAGLVEEVARLKEQGVDVLVSLLTAEETEEEELQQEADLCVSYGIEFVRFPIPDRDVPPRDGKFARFFQSLLARLTEGKRVAIHCWAGVGRSGLVATCLLVAQDVPLKAAVRAVSSARGWPVPDTEEQLKWAAEFAASYRNDESS
jgi:protein-tyrosine phosphatase